MLYFLGLIGLCACRSQQEVNFANYTWKINDATKYIYSDDYSWVFTLNNRMLDPQTTLIGDKIAIDRYPGLYKYLKEVLADIRLEIDSVLLYIPTEHKAFVTYRGDDKNLIPTVYTSAVDSANTSMLNIFNMDIVKDDGEDVYSNLFFNKGKKRFVAVDRFHYGNRPVAMITILQTPTQETEKIGEPFRKYALSQRVVDYSDPETAEPLGWDLAKRKKIYLLNYELGQRLKKIKESK